MPPWVTLFIKPLFDALMAKILKRSKPRRKDDGNVPVKVIPPVRDPDPPTGGSDDT